MQSGSSTTPSQQWIICHVGYQHVNNFKIKELCALSIQTGKYHTWYVQQPPHLSLLDDWADKTYTIQFAQHGLEWQAGNVHLNEMVTQLSQLVPKSSDIFVMNNYLCNFLKTVGFWDVTILELPHLDKCADKHCGMFHKWPNTTICAQRNCHEIFTYLEPILVKYLDPEYAQSCRALRILVMVERHLSDAQQLEASFANLQVNGLVVEGNQGGQHSVERGDGGCASGLCGAAEQAERLG
jgi:hypothetical protein